MAILGFARRGTDAAVFRDLCADFSQSTGIANAILIPASGLCIAAPDVASDDRFTVALQGRPRLRGKLVDARGILDAFAREGPRLVAWLRGPFALVIDDASAAKAVLAIDRMGIERLAYCSNTNGLFFGTSAAAVRRLPGVAAEIRMQGLYDFLCFHMVPAPNTIFRDIYKLPAAHVLEWSDGHATCSRYWRPKFESASRASFDDRREELHLLLTRATQRAEPDACTGAFLSGGLDSSTVAGFLTKVRAEPAQTFSIGFGVESYDELKYARIAAAHFGCESHEYDVTPADTAAVMTLIATAYDEPFGNSSAVPTYYCAKLAANAGIDHLLAGDGGDELFGGNERYATQKLFEAYGMFPLALRHGFIEPLVPVLTRAGSVLPPLRKLARYVERARVALPDRLAKNFAFSVDVHDMLSDDFAASVDATQPLEQMRAVYQSVDAETLLDRLLAYDWRFTLAENDLRKVTTMCELAGVRVSFPMLDDDLVEFSARIPARDKMRGTQLRTFYKRAMRGFLPNEVLAKRKHGFGLPFGVWLKTDETLAEMTYSNLAGLDSRGIFKKGFIADVIEQHRSGPASYYGYFLWDLAMLEEWLRIHV